MSTFPCPTCQRPVEWSAAAAWRPFCSERCRLIDLGAWMTEKHAIAGEEISPDGVPPPGGEPGPDDSSRH